MGSSKLYKILVFIQNEQKCKNAVKLEFYSVLAFFVFPLAEKEGFDYLFQRIL